MKKLVRTNHSFLAVFLFWILLSQGAGVIGSLATAPAIDAWYSTLEKPFFNPPNWLFAPVWLTLYTLMGVAAARIWIYAQGAVRFRAVSVFVLQLILNTLWSLVFFGLQALFGGLVVIVVLFAAILWVIVLFDRIDRTAALLLIPYLFWVGFATLLNAAFFLLN